MLKHVPAGNGRCIYVAPAWMRVASTMPLSLVGARRSAMGELAAVTSEADKVLVF
jgi:hypothetical protein